MARVLFFLALLVAAASAFVAPSQHGAGKLSLSFRLSALDIGQELRRNGIAGDPGNGVLDMLLGIIDDCAEGWHAEIYLCCP